MLGEGHAALTTLWMALSNLLLVSLASINLGKAYLSCMH